MPDTIAKPLWPDLQKDILALLSVLQTKGRTASFFGMRISPISGKPQYHNGQDIPKPDGTPICLPWDGTLVKFWFDPKTKDGGYGGGNSMLWLHRGEVHMTGYCHLSKFNSSLISGVSYPAGTTIGYIGSTGDSTGNHLHFTCRQVINGKAEFVDPLPFLIRAASIAEMPEDPGR